MSNDFYITLAYGLTWVVMVSYALYLGRRLSRAEREAGESRTSGGGRS